MKDDFPKFQYSVFTHNGHDGQYVIRSNDKDEFILMKTWLETILPKEEPKTPVDLSIGGTKGQGGKCPVHGTELVWKTGTSKTTNTPYAFWSCPTKNADGSYCRAGSKK